MTEKLILSSGQVPVAACPTCATKLDAATGISDSKYISPKPGDITLCLYCGTFLRYGEKLQLAQASEDQINQIEPKYLQMAERIGEKFREMKFKKGRTS